MSRDHMLGGPKGNADAKDFARTASSASKPAPTPAPAAPAAPAVSNTSDADMAARAMNIRPKSRF